MSDEIETITQNIRRAVRCPICYGSAVDFDYVCENGHIVCRACVGGMVGANKSAGSSSCPSCRGRPVTGSPMTSVLRLVFANLSVACANRADGCPVVANILDIGQHETRCSYKRIPAGDDKTDFPQCTQ